MRLSSLPNYKRNASRFTRILGVLAKYGLAGWLGKSDPEFLKKLFKSSEGEVISGLGGGERIRLAATELGPTFIKLGQILSTRSDLVGPDVSGELEKLQSDVPADPEEVVRERIREELGAEPEELFAAIDYNPLGSASIGQVHSATLKDGRQVVIKVQHPDIEQRIREDLDILEGMAGIAEEFAKELRNVNPRATVREFRKILLRELDYRRELQNLTEFARNFAKQDEVHFPVPVPEVSTARILTMERLHGTGFKDLEGLDAANVDRRELALTGANVYLDMIFRDGFYHADPHPGNLLVLEDGTLGMLDCGMTGRVDQRTMEELSSLVIAAVSQDADDLVYYVSRLGSLPPDLDREQLVTDLGEFLGEYAKNSLESLDVGAAIEDGVAIIRNHGIRLRPGISLLLKVLVMLEGTSRLLDRDFSMAEVLEPFVKKLIRRRLSPKENLKRMVKMAKDWDRLVRGFPRHANQILERVDQGQFRVNLEHQRLDTATNRLVLGMLAAALFIGSAMILAAEVVPLVFGVSLFGVLGSTAAIALGVILLRAIHNSNDLN
jgi:ubiquinone biosynthesis protein